MPPEESTAENQEEPKPTEPPVESSPPAPEEPNDSNQKDNDKEEAPKQPQEPASTAEASADDPESADNPAEEDVEEGSVSFPYLLVQLLESDANKKSLEWGPNGDTFCVYPGKFENQILPVHFPGTKFGK